MPATSNDYALQELFWSNGGSEISDNGKVIQGVMNSKQNIQALGVLQTMVKDKSVDVVGGGGAAASETTFFQAGQFGMMEDGIWPLEQFKQAKLNFGTVVLPKFPGKPVQGVIHQSGVAMSKDSKNKALEWEFIKFFASAKSADIRLGDLPVLKSVAKDRNGVNLLADPYYKPFYAMVNHGQHTAAFMLNSNWNQVEPILDNAISAVLLGKSDPKTALDNAVKQAQPLIK